MGPGTGERKEGGVAGNGGGTYLRTSSLDVRSEGPEVMPGTTPADAPPHSRLQRRKRQAGTGESGGRLGEAGLCSALEVTGPDGAARLPDQLH